MSKGTVSSQLLETINAYQHIIDASPEKEPKKKEVSNEIPALLEIQAKKLTTEPFKGNPPHHGISAEEVLNTSLIRKFANLKYTQISSDIIDRTEKDELAILFSEAIDMSQKKTLEESATASNEEQLQSEPATEECLTTSEILIEKPSNQQIESAVQDKPTIETADIKAPAKSQTEVQPEASETILTISESQFVEPNNQQIKSAVQDATSLDAAEIKVPSTYTPEVRPEIVATPESEQSIQQAFLQTAQTSSVVTSDSSLPPPSEIQPILNQTDSLNNSHTQDQAYNLTPDSQTQSLLEPQSPPASESTPTLPSDAIPKLDSESFSKLSSEERLVYMVERAKSLGLISDEDSDEDDDDDLALLTPPKYKRTEVKQSSSVDGHTAQYKQCDNFEEFAGIFKQIKAGLQNASLILVPATGQGTSRKLNIGDVFLIKNEFYLIVDMNTSQTYQTKHQKGSKYQARIHVVTDSGKEIRPFDTSFVAKFDKAKTSRVVSANDKGFQIERMIKAQCEKITQQKSKPPVRAEQTNVAPSKNIVPTEVAKDNQTLGYIYVLATQSDNPAVVEYKAQNNLIKIGFTTQTLEQRFKNAEKEATFLEAPVTVLAFLKCHNFDPHLFEQCVHAILNQRRSNITIKSHITGKTYTPQEWFNIDLETALEVIKRIADRSIIKYHLNPLTGRLVPNKK